MAEGPTATARFRAELTGAWAEFLASLFFVFFGAGSVCGAVKAVGEPVVVEPINYAASFGFAITFLAFAIGDVSGGHINPAVTVALAATGNVTLSRAVLYLIGQFAGGIVGGGLLRACVGAGNYNSGIGLAADLHPAGGFGLEAVGTLVLVFVVFNVAVWAGKPLENDIGGSTISALAPLPIGLTVLVVHLTLGPFTGCGINPMRVLGAIVWEDTMWWEAPAGVHVWIYFAGPLAAALVGPLLYLSIYGTVKPGSAGKKPPPLAAADAGSVQQSL